MSATNFLEPDDYAVIMLMILFSSGIGIYYGISRKKASAVEKSTTKTTHGSYFLADRKMTILPVALSAFATSIASSSVIGLPVEIYTYGMQAILWVPMHFLIAYIINQIFIPLYYSMGSMNVFKFLEARYNKMTKNIVSVVIITRMILIGSNIIYGTSTALSQASNINPWIIMLFLIGTCIIYTTLGGMKGVMYADTAQSLVMMFSMLSALAIGLVHVGGVGAVFKSNMDSGRLDIFNFDIDPTARHTVWTSTLGYTMALLALTATSQPIIQRYLTAPTIQDAQRGNMLGMAFYAAAVLTSQLIGCVMYAEYRDCDPLKSKAIENVNQLVPAFVMKMFSPYPLLPGVFFAGLVSACLSTLSSIFNSGSAMIVETLILPLKAQTKPSQMATTCKIVASLMGLCTMVCVLPISQFANIKQAAVSISAIMDGPTLVLIVAGILFPQANSKAVLCAYMSGISMNLWLVAGTLLVHAPHKTKPLSVLGCLIPLSIGNATSASTSSPQPLRTTSDLADFFPLNSVSYLWISLTGFLVTSAVLAVMSHLFAPEQNRRVSLDVIPKAVQNVHLKLSKPWRKLLLCDVYEDEFNFKQNEEHVEMSIKC